MDEWSTAINGRTTYATGTFASDQQDTPVGIFG